MNARCTHQLTAHEGSTMRWGTLQHAEVLTLIFDDPHEDTSA